MTDDLPSVVVYQAGTASRGSFSEANGIITWNVSLGPSGTLLLPSQGRATITFTVQVSPAWTANVEFVNTAEITGAGELVHAQVSARTVVTSCMYLPLVVRYWPPVPYTPILDAIDNPDEGFNDYVVSWSYDYTGISATSYTLQEATNADFTGAVTNYSIPHTGIENSRQFVDQPDGTYYYRVRGHNGYGPGPWSNVESVTIFTVYYDNFDNPDSGWPYQHGKMEDGDGDTAHWYTRYNSGDYQILIGDVDGKGPADWFKQPDALAPYSPPGDKYCVETNVRFEEGHYWANMGLVFGASADNRTLYALCLGRDSDQSQLGWFMVRKDDYTVPVEGCAKPDASIGGTDRTGTSREGWNRLQVSVDGDTFKVYIGGHYKGQYSMGGLHNMTRVGVIGGTCEIPPIDIRFQYFRVLPNASCTP
jgi:hypothetical protein